MNHSSSRTILISVHVMVWVLLLLLPFIIGDPYNHYQVGYTPALFFSLGMLLQMVIFYGHSVYLFPRFCNRRWWWLYLVSSILLVVICVILKFRLVEWWFTPFASDHNVRRFIISSSLIIFIISVLYSSIEQRIRQEGETARIELQLLRAQINPHFIFNVMTNLVALARKQSDKLEPALIKLADMLRYSLYDGYNNKVPLLHEIEYLNNYIDLQQMRFGTEVTVSREIDSDLGATQYKIEPMLLLPFLENAFKHGTGFTTNAIIRMRLSVKNGTLLYTVENKFNYMSGSNNQESSGIGLDNVIRRLTLRYHNKFALKIDDQSDMYAIMLTLKLA